MGCCEDKVCHPVFSISLQLSQYTYTLRKIMCFINKHSYKVSSLTRFLALRLYLMKLLVLTWISCRLFKFSWFPGSCSSFNTTGFLKINTWLSISSMSHTIFQWAEIIYTSDFYLYQFIIIYVELKLTY